MQAVYRPQNALAPFVDAIGYFTNAFPHRLERSLPGGRMSLMINLADDVLGTYDATGRPVQETRGAALQGPSSRSSVIDTAQQRSIICVSFAPAGAAPFFALPMGEVRESLVDLDALWGRDGGVLRERLLEAPTIAARLRIVEDTLLAHAVRPLAPDPAIAFAVQALEHGAPVGAVVDELGLTPKRFLRRFGDELGLTPKRYARVRRFQRLLATANASSTVDWAELAARHGYYDQAHLIHDFRALSGLNPTAYTPRDPAEQNHVPL